MRKRYGFDIFIIFCNFSGFIKKRTPFYFAELNKLYSVLLNCNNGSLIFIGNVYIHVIYGAEEKCKFRPMI